VWSVWSKTIQLYISATGSMVKAPHRPVLVVPHPATLPLDRVLLRITEALNKNVASNSVTNDTVAKDSSSNSSAANSTATLLKKAKLQITLGGSICPPIPWQVPSGINNWKELTLLAHNTAAQQLALPATDLVCTWSPATPSVLCAMPQWWMQSLQSWAHQQQAQVASIGPLWALASDCTLARNPAVQGLCVYEDDGVVSQTNPQIAAGDTSILTLKFSQVTQPLRDASQLQHGPRAWAQHWYTA
jgi:hypothetical protein